MHFINCGVSRLFCERHLLFKMFYMMMSFFDVAVFSLVSKNKVGRAADFRFRRYSLASEVKHGGGWDRQGSTDRTLQRIPQLLCEGHSCGRRQFQRINQKGFNSRLVYVRAQFSYVSWWFFQIFSSGCFSTAAWVAVAASWLMLMPALW